MEVMRSKKRERSANFVANETQLLMRLVDKYKHIIENKKTDAKTNKAKMVAWKRIEISFNSFRITTVFRSWKTLKLKYEGVRKSTKKKSYNPRQQTSAIGGGPSNNPESITIPSIFESNIVTLDTTEINTLDIDDQNEPTESQQYKKMTDESLILDIKEEGGEILEEAKWHDRQPEPVSRRVSSELNVGTGTQASTTEQLDELGIARLGLIQLQMETVRKEQKYMEEEHKLKMIYLATEERRKQEIHELLVQKINSASSVMDSIL